MFECVMSSILDFLMRLKLTDIVTCIVSVWMACVATMALNTWKRQSEAKKQTDFLDDLTDTVHKYINALSVTFESVKLIKIGIKCYEGTVPSLDKGIINPEAVAYIEKYGEDMSMQLNKDLEHCKASMSKIQALVAKGQVLGLKDYAICQNSCKLLVKQYEQVQKFSFAIGLSSANWKKDEIQDFLTKELSIDYEGVIKEHVSKSNMLYLTFVKSNYENIFK